MTMLKNVNGVEIEMTAEEEAEFLASIAVINQTQVADYQVAIQGMIDETARSKLFNDGVTMASYVASTVEPWAAQALIFVAWRDSVWQYAYSELSKVQAGEREQPTVSGFLLELPEIVWP